jgi:hypothetical protein
MLDVKIQEMNLAIALESGTEVMVRLTNPRLGNWLDGAKVYIDEDEGFRIFVYQSFGSHQWQDEVTELTKTLSDVPKDGFAIQIRVFTELEAGDIAKFRLDEVSA